MAVAAAGPGVLVLGALLLACSGSLPARLEVEPLDAAIAEGGGVPWTALVPLEGPDEFRFAVVTDRTGGHRAGVFRDAMGKLNLLQPAFVVSVGDLIEGYSEDRAELDGQWDEVESTIGALEMPFFYVPGNHDMSNRVMAEVWRRRFGPSYYHFRYKGVLFLALNSELFGMVHDPATPVPGPDTQAEQMAFVERVLAESRDVRSTFVLVHQPLWDRDPVPADWLRVEELLGDRPFTVFAGHVHAYTKHVRRDRSFLTLATTGGESGLRGLARGEFDHVVLVTVKERGPVVANLLLDGIHGEDVRSEATRAVARRLAGAVRSEPPVGAAGPFRSGAAHFAIRNDADVPLDVVAAFSGSADLEVEPSRVARRIGPRGEDRIRVALRAEPPVALARLAPGRARLELRAPEPGGGGPVEVVLPFALQPEARFPCAPGPGPVVVDGALDEWPELPFAVRTPAQVDHPELYDGPHDLRFRFGVRCDADGVYVGVAVEDDARVASPERTAREQDRVFALLDPRPDPERSRNTTLQEAFRDGSLAGMLRGDAGPGAALPELVVRLFLPPPPPGVRSAGRPTPAGYAAEFSFPRAALDERQDGAWRAFRLQLSVADFDPGEPGHSTLYWRPDRFGEVAVAGSGTFVRAAAERP